MWVYLILSQMDSLPCLFLIMEAVRHPPMLCSFQGSVCAVQDLFCLLLQTAYNFYMVAVDCMYHCQSVIYYFFKTFEPLRFHRVNWRSHRSEWLIPAYLFSMPFMTSQGVSSFFKFTDHLYKQMRPLVLFIMFAPCLRFLVLRSRQADGRTCVFFVKLHPLKPHTICFCLAGV